MFYIFLYPLFSFILFKEAFYIYFSRRKKKAIVENKDPYFTLLFSVLFVDGGKCSKQTQNS